VEIESAIYIPTLAIGIPFVAGTWFIGRKSSEPAWPRRLLLSVLLAIFITPTLRHDDRIGPAWSVAASSVSDELALTYWLRQGVFPIVVSSMVTFSLWQMIGGRRDYYFFCASISSILAQYFVYYRIPYWSTVKDWSPGQSSVITNFLLASLVLLAMVPVLRVGRRWQRLCGISICIYPVIVALDYICWSVRVLSES